MMEGGIQAIDSAYIGANACLENMQPKDVQIDWYKNIQVFKNENQSTNKENISIAVFTNIAKGKEALTFQ